MSLLFPRVRGLSKTHLSRFIVSAAYSRATISTLPSTISGFLEFTPTEAVENVKIDGYVRSVRAQKRHHFVALGDGSSLQSLQAVVPVDQAEGWVFGLRGSRVCLHR